MSDEQAIRAVIDARIDALRRKDAAAATATLSADVVAFEMAPPLQLGAAEARSVEGLQAWLDGWDGPVETEVSDLRIHVAGDVAFCHSLNRLRGTKPGGGQVDMWMRSTLGFRKTGGEWKIVHGHTSVPFRMDGSFRAALDLKP